MAGLGLSASSSSSRLVLLSMSAVAPVSGSSGVANRLRTLLKKLVGSSSWAASFSPT